MTSLLGALRVAAQVLCRTVTLFVVGGVGPLAPLETSMGSIRGTGLT